MAESERFNLAEWLLDRNVREGRGDRPALRFEDRVYGYAELADLQNRTGNALKVGSSRVDLQACKLEYSIVSPK